MNTTKNLSAGTVTVYDFGKIKLHAYDTKDALCDAAFIVEGENALVGIELPAFTENLDAWKEYIASLKKPMKDIIISDHPAGADYIKEMNVWGTENAKKSVSGGTAFGITQGLLKAFGPAFRGNFVASIKNILREGKNTIAGIDFVIYDRGSSFDVEIPAANAIYTHMLGKHVHSINVEEQDAVTEKIAYVKKLRGLAAQCKTRIEFICAAEKAFPDYAGKNYLEMTAGNLFKE